MGNDKISEHYTHGGLIEAISSAINALGKTPETVTIDDLAPADEFHVGGRTASIDFLSQLELTSENHSLDIGCGLGGTARFVATTFGGKVTGIDLTSEYIETGKALSEWTGLSPQISLHCGSALDLPFADATFDSAYLMHVGMNIADKTRLFQETFRALQPGSTFGIYDIMRTGEAPVTYPMPWSTKRETSYLASPSDYKETLKQAGFQITSERNRSDFALAFFKQLQASNHNDPSPLGLHIVMGANMPEKIGNMVSAISDGIIAPTELICRKP